MQSYSAESERELFPLSWLTQYGYCPRRCGLMALEQLCLSVGNQANRDFLTQEWMCNGLLLSLLPSCHDRFSACLA